MSMRKEGESDALCCAHCQSHCFLKDTAAKGQEGEKKRHTKRKLSMTKRTKSSQ